MISRLKFKRDLTVNLPWLNREFTVNKPFRVFDAADLTQKIAFYQAESLTEKDEKLTKLVAFYLNTKAISDHF